MTNSTTITINCSTTGQHTFGYKTVDHGGYSHPTGPQVCLDCGKTFDELCRESQDRQDLIKRLEEKSKVMAHIVGSKRVDTKYITWDDVIATIKERRRNES